MGTFLFWMMHRGIWNNCIVGFTGLVYLTFHGTRPHREAINLILTHWGRVTHICVSDLTNIGSDNGLSPGRRQAIIRTTAGILLIRPLGTNFSEFLVQILIFSFKKMHLKVVCEQAAILSRLNEPNIHSVYVPTITSWVLFPFHDSISPNNGLTRPQWVNVLCHH